MGAAVTGQEKNKEQKQILNKNVFFLHWSVVKILITSIKYENEPAGINFSYRGIKTEQPSARERASQNPEQNILTFNMNIGRPQLQAYLNKSCSASHSEISAGVTGLTLLN